MLYFYFSPTVLNKKTNKIALLWSEKTNSRTPSHFKRLVITMPLNLLFKVIYVSILLCSVVQGTLTPNGTVPSDCGSQQTFTCSVTGGVAWTISLDGISVAADNGQLLAANSPRITTTDTSGVTQSSTITITGFNTSDDGGTIQCIDQANNSVQGMANISVGIPSCPNGVNSTLRNIDCDVSLTWQQPPNTPPVTSTTVTYCPTSSPNCGDSMNCTTSPCTISGLLEDIEYQFTVIPNNNCGSATGCTGNTVTRRVVFHSEICSPDTTPTTDSTPQPTVSTVLIIGVVVAVVLLALIIAIITTILICCLCPVVKTCFVTTCCCKSGSDAKNKPPREEQPRDDYADPQTVRDNRELTEENGITYAALQFSEEAGGNGKNGIHRKEELDNLQYSEVEHLQV